MAGRLSREIKQTKPFQLLEEEACLNILRTAEVVNQYFNEFLKGYELSSTQYNVLRILRGAGKAGLACCEVSARMVSSDPDITRLLDRMEARGWVLRERSSTDRRVVLAKISPAALKVLGEIDEPLRKHVRSTIGRLAQADLTHLIERLEAVREVFS